jgi:ADP-ribose pyrophosphatase YjhB (NUDIX family)
VTVSARRYPDRPYVGVGAVIVREREVLLVKRKFEPLQGRWSLPGGAVEAGETLQGCLVREMREETGLDVEVGPVIEVLDRITHDEEGRVLYHFVLVDYLCRPVGGALRPGTDVETAVFADAAALAAFELPDEALRVIARALRLAAGRPAWRGRRP